MVPKPSERMAFLVDSFAESSCLLWRTPNRSWAWRLIPLAGGRTRLITRLKTVYEWRRPLALATVVLMECADYPMMRRMLRGIRTRPRLRSRPLHGDRSNRTHRHDRSIGAGDGLVPAAARGYAGLPASIHWRKTATRSAGHAPSHGIVPASSRPRIASA